MADDVQPAAGEPEQHQPQRTEEEWRATLATAPIVYGIELGMRCTDPQSLASITRIGA